MGKILEFDEKARRAMERGVNILADTVKVFWRTNHHKRWRDNR